ncbi:MAG: hypothetical protein ACM3KR_05200 [Deltaproteobacteria bacterium]
MVQAEKFSEVKAVLVGHIGKRAIYLLKEKEMVLIQEGMPKGNSGLLIERDSQLVFISGGFPCEAVSYGKETCYNFDPTHVSEFNAENEFMEVKQVGEISDIFKLFIFQKKGDV